MKLIILKTNLVDGLGSVERSVGDNTNLPILKNVLIKTDGNKIILTATNLELAVNYVLPGKILENGEITVPFAVLNNVIKNLNSERVNLETKNKQLLINTDNYEAQIQGLEAKEFPIIPTVNNQKKPITIAVDLLKESLGSVVVATQHSDIRPEISGVLFRFSSEGLTLVATDSFRLAEKKIDSSKISTTLEEASVIIPLKVVAEALRIIKSEENSVDVFLDSNQILFKTQNLELVSHLIDGKFPEYQAIIPKEVRTESSVDREEMMNAIKLTSSFASRISDITLKSGDNKKFLEAYSASSALGENRYKIPAKIKGDKFSIVFNWRYFLDGLKIYKGEEVTVGINAADRPAVIKSLSDPSLIYVLMPLKS